jgi:hypothetical protein
MVISHSTLAFLPEAPGRYTQYLVGAAILAEGYPEKGDTIDPPGLVMYLSPSKLPVEGLHSNSDLLISYWCTMMTH